MRLASKLLFSFVLVLVFHGTGNSATLYMATTGTDSGNCQSSACLTLRYAVSQMSGGDTLTIADGTYSGTSNYLNESNMPPSGSDSSHFTTIKSTNDGGAIFSSGFLRMESSAVRNYVSIEGIKVTNYQTGQIGGTYWKWLRCSFDVEPADDSNDVGFGLTDCSYILVEDCWAFGGGRYKFSAYGSTLGNLHHIVYRRCVARFDRAHATWPIAAFAAYRSQYVDFQNCIVIDGDQDQFWTQYEERAGAFYIPWLSEYTTITGCIVLNHASYAWGGYTGDTFTVSNSVAWTSAGGWASRGDGATYTGGTISNVTIGVGNTERDRTAYGATQYLGGTGTIPITNSIFYDQTNYGISGSSFSSDYNVMYANDADYSGLTDGSNDYCAANSNAIDPVDGTPGNGTACLKYLTRIETGSNCKSTGSSSADRGANILYKIGTSGTFYGDSGYNTVTTESLWPWPYESRIKTDMAAYSYTGAIYPSGTDTLSGARGFCTGTSIDGSSQTLTKYIWEYLGNQIPSEIYGPSTITGLTITGGN